MEWNSSMESNRCLVNFTLIKKNDTILVTSEFMSRRTKQIVWKWRTLLKSPKATLQSNEHQNEPKMNVFLGMLLLPSCLLLYLPLPLSPAKCIFRMSWESIHFRYARLPKSTAIMISKNVLNFFCVAVLCIVLACLRKFYKFIEKWKELTLRSRTKCITERNQRN